MLNLSSAARVVGVELAFARLKRAGQCADQARGVATLLEGDVADRRVEPRADEPASGLSRQRRLARPRRAVDGDEPAAGEVSLDVVELSGPPHETVARGIVGRWFVCSGPFPFFGAGRLRPGAKVESPLLVELGKPPVA